MVLYGEHVETQRRFPLFLHILPIQPWQIPKRLNHQALKNPSLVLAQLILQIKKISSTFIKGLEIFSV
jgi:hypothetical protein